MNLHIKLYTTQVLFADEVATITNLKSSKEILLSLTDEKLFGDGEKKFMIHPCRFKTTTSFGSNFRENNLPQACRAEITKFLLNAGYKSLDAKTFIKQ